MTVNNSNGGGSPPQQGAGQGQAPNQALTPGPSPKQGEEGQQAQPTFDAWLAEQPDTVKTMYEGHVRGLRSALSSERDGRAGLEKQLRDLTQKAEKGSEMQQELGKLADQVTEATRKTEFYEQAQAAGVSNLKLAYLAATNEGLFDRQGRPNFEALRQGYPELFSRPKAPQGHAGAGAGAEGVKGQTMNDWIRRSAGRG